MTPKDFEKSVLRTLNPGLDPMICDHELKLANCSLGLAGESGELVDLVKKFVFHRKPMDRKAAVLEAGDVLYYLTGLLSLIGSDLEEAMQMNADKLSKRYPNGFSVEDSAKRADVK